ncbi:glutaredoxin domain-containing protein [Bacillus sp. DJP31]|uniref:glutaredoxin domain-containing protein n=1 Tax=Bacillus sp. DJP31 TaxID=3409789 RepID=UPI003BB4D4E1
MDYTLYTIDGCLRCFSVKKILENNEILYIEKNVLHDVEARSELIRLVDEVIAPVLINTKNGEVLKWDQLQSTFI